MLNKLIWIFVLSIFMWSCAKEKEEDLISGLKLTGDKMADALVLAALTAPTCQFLTNENANTPFELGEGSISICSVVAASGSFSVKTSGSYEVSGNSGRQTLTSNNCNSKQFDFIVAFKDGNTELYSSSGGMNKQMTLETGKIYTIQSSGLADPNNYKCSGLAVSSHISAYRLNVKKL
ncbi:hypothetical protein EHQ16_00495 [Leptospira kanakyensis]|uniref:Uncharacterized protein n=1 Tax=Leptospira kanakyensis TaxID=2484968 RepID=A0A6N4PS14_9LEPT|nr:hypothetical protein [Leptospira kanakyensis]TGK46130.1 hypothetical protein EHQ11_19485 [Leptospira kanakyensis]TGK65067.1 hypothetical protein EHQ16_00495 [Leptospira kanakyensis]TGK65499.1 hypothetical protein EHQ18_19705 [Leptospira kanakyensis]